MLQQLCRHAGTPEWENHTTHQLRAGKFSVTEATEGVDSAVSSTHKELGRFPLCDNNQTPGIVRQDSPGWPPRVTDDIVTGVWFQASRSVFQFVMS